MADTHVNVKPGPYHFMPITLPLAILDEPQLHDHLNLDENCTGELHCTMTALTPLLAANYQYPIADPEDGPDQVAAEPTIQRAYRALVEQRLPGWSPQQTPIKHDKAIIEPLRATHLPDAPVLIGGAALKGMIRQSLSALLSAPMERVGERSFSYRPNVKLLGKNDPNVITPHVGVVAYVDKDGKVAVWPVQQLINVSYVRPEHEAELLIQLGGEEEAMRRINALHNANKMDDVRAALENLKVGNGDYLLRYRTGVDGSGVLQEDFNKKNPEEKTRRYQWVQIPTHKLLSQTEWIPKHIVDGWVETLRHLSDVDHGHLRGHPLADAASKDKTKKSLQDLISEGLRPGDVVFYEKVKKRVLTLGHHFRYRWRYRDSIRFYTKQPGNDTFLGEALRDVLCPHADERQSDPHGKPKRLTGARLFFGYVAPKSNESKNKRLLADGIGQKKNEKTESVSTDFSQLAGRIAINMAVEQVSNRTTSERFLNNADHYQLVPLRPLSGPKASAVEHYLRQQLDVVAKRHNEAWQDNGVFSTYGDDATDPSAGALHGRKFYLHNPHAADNTGRALFELMPDNKKKHEEDDEMLVSNQAAIGRFISTPGTQFRFAVRFTNLRKWELGCLLFTLSPDLDTINTLLEWLEIDADQCKRLQLWLSRVQQWEKHQRQQPGHENAPLLAHKLGHGRPLGLGSVRIQVDKSLRLQRSEEMLVDLNKTDDSEDLIAEFAQQIVATIEAPEQRITWVEEVLLPWLQLHRYAGRKSYEYPRHPEKKTVYDYHTDLRSAHAEGRRLQAAKKGKPRVYGLPPLDNLDKREAL